MLRWPLTIFFEGSLHGKKILRTITRNFGVLDSWHDAIETMDKYQEWVDPPMTDKSGYQFLISMLCKIICFMLFCIFQAKVTTCETIVCVIKILSKAVISTSIAIYKWFNKPRIPHTKKHCKTSNGSGKFSHNLRKSKKSCYNERNCKTRKHGRWHTLMKRNSRTKWTTTNNTSQDLKIKGRKLGISNPPSSKT